MSDNESEVSRDLSVADGAAIVRRKPKWRTYYKYRNSALSASGAQLCQRIQREWANVEVARDELLTQMMLYMTLCSENLRLGDEVAERERTSSKDDRK
jgi:hypothetical protein